MFLDDINSVLFAPLASKNSRFYGVGLEAVYNELTKIDSTGECSPKLAREVIQTALIMASANGTLTWSEENEDVEVEQEVDEITRRASQIYSRLKEAGWLVEMEYTGYTQIVFMPRDASQMFLAIKSISNHRPSSSEVTFYRVYDYLKKIAELEVSQQSFYNSPFVVAEFIAEGAKIALDYLNNLSSVVVSMRDVSLKMRATSGGAGLMRTFFEEFLSDALSPYEKLSQQESFFSHIQDLKILIGRFRRDDDFLEFAAHAAIRDQAINNPKPEDYNKIRIVIESDLQSIMSVIQSVPKLIERIVSYRLTAIRRTHDAMRYSTTHSTMYVTDIINAINSLKKLSLKDEALLPFSMRSYRIVGEQQLVKSRVPPPEPTPTKKVNKQSDPMDLAISRCRQEYIHRRAPSPRRVVQYINRHMNGRTQISSKELIIECLEDFLAFNELKDHIKGAMPRNEPLEVMSNFKIERVVGGRVENIFINTPELLITVKESKRK